MQTKIKKYFLTLLLLQLFFSFTPAFAQTADYTQGNPNCGNTPNACPVSGQIEKYLCAPTSTSANNLYDCINRLYKFAIVLAVVIGVFFVVIAGYIYMAAEGNSESVDKAKNILTSTIASLVILVAGYLLLQTINPDLVQFQSIQPPSVVLPSSTVPSITGAGSVTPGTAVTNTYTTPNGAVADLQGSNCAFSTDKQKNEAPQMVSQLESIVKNVCWNVSQNPSFAGHPVTISSIIGVGQHATNSYHYKGCAVDFANGDPNIVNSPYGQAIIQFAKSAGISASRINPGVDATRTDIIHIDLGTSCPNATNVDPNSVE